MGHLVISGDEVREGRLMRPDGRVVAWTSKNMVSNRLVATLNAVEAQRLLGLGATQVREVRRSEQVFTWLLMQDTEGNEFGICDGGQSGTG